MQLYMYLMCYLLFVLFFLFNTKKMQFDHIDPDSIWCTQTIQDILDRKHRDSKSAENSLLQLRNVLLTNPCPPELRDKVWKLLLRMTHISASSYIHLVELGPSPLDEKIRHDTFRTMTTDATFLEHVSEDMLIRLLNAFVWTCDEKESQVMTFRSHHGDSLTYVQGMNVLAAPFLMVMPEMEAFFSFSTFIWKWCPLYVQPSMKGVHCGLRLLDLCLRYLDPTLYGYLRGKNLSASTYAFASVMTFSACTPPVKELLQLWDYMFAYGLHLNILFIIAQLALIRTEILKSPSPVNLLRVLPPLRAKDIIHLTISLCKNLSANLYDKLVRHAYDESVANELGIRPTSNWPEQQDDTIDLPAYMIDAMNMRK
ncbi:rab-GTPase-TBC domain-containing protein [Gilbertella persicaria]|nr:rab-GTPase-TBC domain-containing protein [Gilbertella persicaria]KAI8080794.1 rab-GTPase-TBC domain-containing protein [Gilbertella persicaria]